MQAAKNRFAAAVVDSDDETPRVTKTQVKKEERKITEKTTKAPKVNKTALEQDGFEVTGNNARTQQSTRGQVRPRGREGRGGRGGARPVRKDADGNLVGAGSNNRERRPFTGKPREEAHPFDRKDGTGRGRRPVKKDGHGKGNVGDDQASHYKRKGEDAVEEEKKEEKPVEVKEPAEPKVEYKTEITGVSMDDFFASRTTKGKVQGRAAEGVKDAKTQANQSEKAKQSTVVQNTYLKGTVAVTADKTVAALTGFGSVKDEPVVEQKFNNTRRQSTKGEQKQQAQKAARRPNAKQALKKTDEDFPSL